MRAPHAFEFWLSFQSLRREVQEKREKAAEAAAKKAANKLDKLRKESAKWAAATVPPEELFKASGNVVIPVPTTARAHLPPSPAHNPCV
eukprot:9484232-Pyramimonas_sp.AAC.1